MRINEAEELLGISKANIRFYEKQGLLTPQRGENRYRDYTDGDIDRLRQIVGRYPQRTDRGAVNPAAHHSSR